MRFLRPILGVSTSSIALALLLSHYLNRDGEPNDYIPGGAYLVALIVCIVVSAPKAAVLNVMARAAITAAIYLVLTIAVMWISLGQAVGDVERSQIMMFTIPVYLAGTFAAWLVAILVVRFGFHREGGG